MRSVGLAGVLLLFVGVPAIAQVEQYDAGMFFDPQGTQQTIQVSGFELFSLYVVAFDLDGQVFGYEGHIESTQGWTFLDPPGGVAWLAAEFTGPASVNLGHYGDFLVGTGGCIPDAPGPLALVKLTLASLSDPVLTDMVFCLGAANFGTFSPPSPGYHLCNGEKIPFGTVPPPYPGLDESCAVANPATVSTMPTSVGAMKARF